MSNDQIGRQLSSRLADSMRDALPLLQFLCNSKANDGGQSAEIWTGPFSALRDDILGFENSDSGSQRSIAIWEEDAESGDFVRSRKHIDLWRFCANVERINRKSDQKRIVFLGESVARGFFFSPLYGPALALERQLCSSGTPVEVVDLAQSNCGSWWLTEVARASCALNPDAFVVFAGNNWRAPPLSSASAEAFVNDGALLTEKDGLATLMERQRQRAGEIAEQTIKELSSIASKAGVPLIFVIPEINLADWASCPISALDVPMMSGPDTEAWVSSFTEAKQALDGGFYSDAERHILNAIKLDGGTSSASLELLARARLQQSNSKDASSTLRQSRDVVNETRVLPGIFSTVADTIRRVGSDVGATVVDLPRVFEEYYANEMPGRTQFLDYCHLNAEGIRVSMAATAKAVKQTLFAKHMELEKFVELAPSPSPEQEGWAHLLAGVHNAHWGQEEELCRYHFKRAVTCHPELKDSGVPQVFEAFRHAAPSVLISCFEELVKNPIASTYLMGYGLISRGLINEFDLLSAMAAEFPELEEHCPDPDFALGALSEIDLLHAHWSHLMDGNRWFRRGFKAAYEFVSVFPFVCSDRKELSIDMTCRIPGAREFGDVVVELNGTEIGRVSAQADWCSVQCMAEDTVVKDGLNKMVIRWPNVARIDLREQLRIDFEAGQKLDTRTHFGHLHDLRIALAA